MTLRYEGREVLWRDLRQRADYFANRSLEWTSTGWPHYAQQVIIASCGQPVSAPQLQR
jgi:hypothetical protein